MAMFAPFIPEAGALLGGAARYALPSIASVVAGELADHAQHKQHTTTQTITDAILGSMFGGPIGGVAGKLPLLNRLPASLMRGIGGGAFGFLSHHGGPDAAQAQAQAPVMPQPSGGMDASQLLSMLGGGGSASMYGPPAPDSLAALQTYDMARKHLPAIPVPRMATLAERMADPNLQHVVDQQIAAANAPQHQSIHQRQTEQAQHLATIESLRKEYAMHAQQMQRDDAGTTQRTMAELGQDAHQSQSDLQDSFRKIAATLAGDDKQQAGLVQHQADEQARQANAAQGAEHQQAAQLAAASDPVAELMGASELQSQGDVRAEQQAASKDIGAARAEIAKNSGQRGAMLADLANQSAAIDEAGFKDQLASRGQASDLMSTILGTEPQYLSARANLSNRSLPSANALLNFFGSGAGQSTQLVNADGSTTSLSPKRLDQLMQVNPQAVGPYGAFALPQPQGMFQQAGHGGGLFGGLG